MGMLQGPPSLFLKAPSSIDPDRQVLPIVFPPSKVLHVLEISCRPCKEVCTHDWRAVKGDDLKAVLLAGPGILDWHVAERDLVIWDLDLEVKGGFEVGLVKAGKSSSGIA